MNAHETQEGVMDSLMEALQTGSAFSRPDQRRKRQTRVAGGKFYRTYTWKRMAKRDEAIQPYMFTNTLSTKLMHEHENVTPTETVRHNMISNRIITKLSTASDSTSFFTPEENQELYKQMLLEEATKTPKQIKRSSRVTYFQKKKQCNRCNLAYYTAMPVFDETPKRDVVLKTVTNFESRCVNTNWESSPLIDENVSLKRARIISPVKQRRVVVSKIRRRNSIVRRAILNRKRIRANNKIAKYRLYSYLQSPPNMSSTMPPAINSSVISLNSAKNAKMSKSVDSLNTRILKTAYTPVKLLRSKHFENLAHKDEAQNILDMKIRSLNSSISTQFSSTDQLTNAQSPILIEMSGVTLLSGNSPLHLIKPDSVRTSKSSLNMSGNIFGKLVSETSSPNAKNNFRLMKKLKDRSWKKKWRFWQTSNDISII